MGPDGDAVDIAPLDTEEFGGFMPAERRVFRIVLEKKTGHEQFGLTCCSPPGGRGLEVLGVTAGVIDDWNHFHPDLALKKGHIITEVNGVGGGAKTLLARVQSDTILELTVSAPAVG